MRADEFIEEEKVDEFVGAVLPALARGVAGGAGRTISQAMTSPAAQQLGKQVLNVGGNILGGLGNAALAGLAKIGGQPQIKNAFLIVDGQPLPIDLNNSQQRNALINLYKTFQK